MDAAADVTDGPPGRDESFNSGTSQGRAPTTSARLRCPAVRAWHRVGGIGREAVTDTAPPRTSQRRLLPLCLLVTAGLADATLGLVGASLAAAQTSDRPIVSIAATVTAEAANQAPFPVRIGPPASIPRDSFVKVRGLPAMAALSEGHAISPGSWAIALNALPNLKILLPAGVTGSADIVVSLVGLDGAVLAEAKSTLVVRGGAQGRQLRHRSRDPPRNVARRI